MKHGPYFTHSPEATGDNQHYIKDGTAFLRRSHKINIVCLAVSNGVSAKHSQKFVVEHAMMKIIGWSLFCKEKRIKIAPFLRFPGCDLFAGDRRFSWPKRRHRYDLTIAKPSEYLHPIRYRLSQIGVSNRDG